MNAAQTLIAIGLFATTSAFAGDCQNQAIDLSAEDVSIIASVRPSAYTAPEIQIAKQESTHTLYGVADQYGRLGAGDLSQIESVQPEGKKIILYQRVARD